MAQVRLIYPRRSDGVVETGTGTAAKPNQPSSDQLQKQTRNGVEVWYEHVPASDARYLDWCKRLGGLVKLQMKELRRSAGEQAYSAAEDDIEWVLAHLPENYVLYEHCRVPIGDKKAVADKGDDSKERRDSYLYGHPGGPRKRFRTPGDFFPHFFWMSSDPEGDPDNCECKICTPDELVKAAGELAKIQYKTYGQLPEFAQDMVKKDTKKAAKKQVKEAPSSRFLSKPPASTAEFKETAVSAAAAKPAARAAKTAIPSAAYSPPDPRTRPRHLDQQWDLSRESHLYRLGEMIWFRADNGDTSPGLITARGVKPLTTNEYMYRIQPLSSPLQERPLFDISENAVTPWLAFSTPPMQTPSLRDVKESFDQIRWEQLPKDDTTARDASMLASKAVDETLTLVQMLTPLGTPTMEFEYNGLYLGSELIWVGDAVRSSRGERRHAGGVEIVIVTKIIDRIHTGSKPSEVFVVGDVYELMVQPANQPAPPTSQLPPRIQADLKFRNAARARALGGAMAWVFVASGSRIPLRDIAGRCYESNRILPLVDPTFRQHVEKGLVPDCDQKLNPRGLALKGANYGTKKRERILAFSKSVPVGTSIHIDFDNDLALQASAPTPAPASASASAPAPSGARGPAGPQAQQQQQQQHLAAYGVGHANAAPPPGQEWQFVQTDPADERGYY